jgi:hypothetical protein
MYALCATNLYTAYNFEKICINKAGVSEHVQLSAMLPAFAFHDIVFTNVSYDLVLSMAQKTTFLMLLS